MYIPKEFTEDSLTQLFKLIKEHPFGSWNALCKNELEVNHLPFILHENEGQYGTLYTHIAKANSVWKNCSQSTNSIIVFQGHHAYISPSWYPSKKENNKVVPTWNYSAVHAYGIPKIIEDKEWLLKHIAELTDIHEKNIPSPWQVNDAPKDFIEKLTQAIVGIEIPISRIIGKQKLGQNRSEDDQKGMIEGLSSQPHSASQALAIDIEKTLLVKQKNNY